MRRKINCFFAAVCLFFISYFFIAPAKAATDKTNNAALLMNLNKALTFLIKVNTQYQAHKDQFKAEMPYIKIIPERTRQIKELKEIVKSYGGKIQEPDRMKLVIDEADNILDALLVDGANEIKVVEICNMFLSEYDDAQLQKTMRLWQDQAVLNYLLFNNISQMSMSALMRTKGIEMRSQPKTMPMENVRP